MGRQCHRIVQAPRSGMHRHCLVAWVGQLIPVGSAWLQGCVHNRGNRSNDWKNKAETSVIDWNPPQRSWDFGEPKMCPTLPLVAWCPTLFVEQATGSHKADDQTHTDEDGDYCSKNDCNNSDWIQFFLKAWPVDKTNREGNLKTLQRKGVTFLFAAATMS